ncbi:hypothetical protein [Bradyrhizobium sp. AUGA SZCCT0182]|uniref:hypothetical protein n=1 Tax=Bradyrhizobium sp. AUGA SZCCT0182 TaxID=2807667 RepID=UPI001BACCA5E|nr:hypothetical protein [Bradyrhizobium sp. AUGA SZCCT0182]MBR1230494.1 hypothetical protein [Bradyrhizobium sp. AUGA SZCCT0182]
MRTIVAPALALSLAILLLGVAAAEAQNLTAGAPKQAPSSATPLPANYRQLIAAYIGARNYYVVRDAKITKPYERWGGLIRGGTFTAVCVAVFRDNSFGIVVRDNWIVSYQGGEIKPIAMGMESCSDLSPFPELMKAIAARRARGGTR